MAFSPSFWENKGPFFPKIFVSFVHLHTHSEYSFLDALPHPADYARAAKEKGMPAVALTDRANMHGIIEFYKACKAEGVQPILGCEMFVAPRSRLDKESGIDAKRSRIVLLAENQVGYKNLMELSTKASLEGYYYIPRIDLDLLAEHKGGLIAILPRAGGEMTPFLTNGDFDLAEKVLKKYQSIFDPENLLLEITARPNEEGEIAFQKNFRIFIERYFPKVSPLPIVATNDVRYLEKSESDVHDTLICMQYTLRKDEADRISFREHDLSFLGEEEMKEAFSDLPDAISNTEKIANRCAYEFEFGINRLPEFPLPEGESSAHSYLTKLCEQGKEKRYGKIPQNAQEIDDRLAFELQVIEGMVFSSYFLIVADFVQWAKRQGIAVGPGRGSAAGSLVAYLLEITDLDPIDHGLYFERFLNPERISMPDIDLDFTDTRRDEVIEYVREKYGNERVAQICTFGTMAARAAVKDVGRVFGIPFSEMNELAKLIPARPGTTLAEALEESKELKEKLEEDEQMKNIFKTAQTIEGNARYISVHACAVIIAPEPIVHFTPLQAAPKDEHAIITQYSAKPLEALGLLKMDFLGLRNLTILEKTLEIILQRTKKKIELASIPMDDAETFALLSKGESIGVFQLESSGMTRYIKDLQPTQFGDLVAMVSLYRPGPMKFIPDYINGKHGKKQISYPHPSLEKVLSPTFGIAVYQEQILEIAKIFGGFTLGEADLLRRAIGKKIASELAAQRQKFIDGAKSQGYEESLALKIFDEIIEPFAGYGFNKSHAACYALIAYQTAYLKAHYPVEFIAALLSCDEDNTDRVILDIEAARKMGIAVLPPSVLESDSTFTVVNEKTIRFGLTAIKGIGESVVLKILEARNQKPFASFSDFLTRSGQKAINKKSLEALAKSGALLCFEKTENILANIDSLLDFSKSHGEKVHSAQDDLFGGTGVEVESNEIKIQEVAPLHLAERLRMEKEVLGMYVSDHPLRGMAPYFQKKGVVIRGISEAMRFSKDKKIKLQGLVTSVRKITTKKKEAMAIITLEDISGTVEIVFFPKSYEKIAEEIQEDSFANISGKAEKREGVWQIIGDSFSARTLEEVRDEAEKDNLMNNDSPFGVFGESQEESGNEEAEEFFEEDVQDFLPHSEEKDQDTANLSIEKSTEKNEKIWEISIQKGTKHSVIKTIRDLLKESTGNDPVVFILEGHRHPFKHGVNVTEELKKEVEQIILKKD